MFVNGSGRQVQQTRRFTESCQFGLYVRQTPRRLSVVDVAVDSFNAEYQTNKMKKNTGSW